MDLKYRLMRFWIKKRRIRLSPTQTIAVAFLAIILLGTALLALPAASKSGQSAGLMGALFTATSATCVTGLVLYDTWTQWTLFGQGVILCLIELGGLGFMAAASLVIFLFRRRIGLRQRMVMAQSMSVSDMEGVVRLQKAALIGSLAFQAAGALILFLRFLPQYGPAKAAWWGVFHAVSAFCNAGFDIFGSIAPGTSVMVFQSDPVVCLTLMALIVVGGLGFFVWEDIALRRRFKRLSVYTRLVLLTTLALILAGGVGFCLLEWSNPGTLGNLSAGDRILNGFFQSVTVRTAGFAAVDQAKLTEAGKALSIFLMLIGGSSGSTAGGVKTVTIVVLALFLWTRARGRQTVSVFRSTIPQEKVMDASAIVTIVVMLAFFGGMFVSATSGISLTDSLFETVSALATVGLTAGVTGSLTLPAQILIIIYMYFGRVGVLTISLGFLMGNRAEERFQYAQTNLLIG